ncbi:inositol-pentakisphosphate 2-kinase [Cercophora newfieldiana]|uniref:Inositol-pentakisphosphate 2-kinase n=1 Tax=Cercophora newfieldiana TaxID=92897 RepID=A0AA39Y6U2_9PEZI|nr:inositol-pentakisphosphate 2-kinase [Cercophora newfieldiana]
MDPLEAKPQFRLIGEGAANVVFKHESDESSIPQGYLLRVPKANTVAYPYSDLQQYWESSIQPLFQPHELVQQHLIPITPSTVAHLNTVLTTSDPLRRHDFRGSRILATATTAMLVQDMAAKDPLDTVFEFKPKWLSQSPSAPSTSTRCRNCAREVQKHASHPPSSSKPPKPIDCPLLLLDCASPLSLSQSITSLAPTLEPGSPNYARLAHWLQTNTLLTRLRDLQTSLDPAGPLAADPEDPDFQLAMTLRDCSGFVRIPADADAPVEARFADLDKKNREAKLEYWRATERGLIEGGYYEGREEEGRVKTNCLFERGGSGLS